MDRRQKRTREAIFAAFSKLLKKKRYENITVQEIIDEANIGRSTFYAHFETKDELLHSLCTDIFTHVFTNELPQETEPDKLIGLKSLEIKLGHILYHLREHESDLKGILAGDSNEIFMRYFRSYLEDLFNRYQSDIKIQVPQDFLMNYLISSFAETVKWWITVKNVYSPEETAEYYMTMLGKHR
ncbi:MAG: TetR/AcrR family transcriptional regulator [Firmicutes bacterium]|nr:TetR/AcrR family transcriptional regulator [Bacillota bacterium]